MPFWIICPGHFIQLKKDTMAKTRLDILLTERGLVPSRERAKTCIMEGLVFVNGQREDKPGSTFDPEKIRPNP